MGSLAPVLALPDLGIPEQGCLPTDAQLGGELNASEVRDSARLPWSQHVIGEDLVLFATERG